MARRQVLQTCCGSWRAEQSQRPRRATVRWKSCGTSPTSAVPGRRGPCGLPATNGWLATVGTQILGRRLGRTTGDNGGAHVFVSIIEVRCVRDNVGRRYGSVSTHRRTGTRGSTSSMREAAYSAIRRPQQLGQRPSCGARTARCHGTDTWSRDAPRPGVARAARDANAQRWIHGVSARAGSFRVHR
jgi:hypothetical protein